MNEDFTPAAVKMSRTKEYFELFRSKVNSGSLTELSWVFLGNLLNVLLGFVILKILSKMGTTEYGIYALIITISSLLSLVFYGPLIQGFMRFYYDYLERGAVHIYLKYIFRIIYVTAAVHLILAVTAGVAAYYLDIGLAPLTVIFAGFYILGLRIGEFFNAFLNLIRKRKENSLLQGGEKILLSAALFVLLYSGNLNLMPVFIILTAAAVLFTFIKINVFRNSVPQTEDNPGRELSLLRNEIRQNLLKYILPFLIWGFTAWLQLNGEKWIIAGLLSTSDVGIYAVMISLINALVVFPSNIISDFSTPIIFQNYADSGSVSRMRLGYTYIKINMLLVLLITILCAAVAALFGKEIIILISSIPYSVYAYLLPWLVIGIGLFYTGQALTILGLALNRPGKYITPKITAGVLSITLNYFLISNLGIAGAAYTALITGLFYLLSVYFMNRRILGTKGAVQ